MHESFCYYCIIRQSWRKLFGMHPNVAVLNARITYWILNFLGKNRETAIDITNQLTHRRWRIFQLFIIRDTIENNRWSFVRFIHYAMKLANRIDDDDGLIDWAQRVATIDTQTKTLKRKRKSQTQFDSVTTSVSFILFLFIWMDWINKSNSKICGKIRWPLSWRHLVVRAPPFGRAAQIKAMKFFSIEYSDFKKIQMLILILLLSHSLTLHQNTTLLHMQYRANNIEVKARSNESMGY